MDTALSVIQCEMAAISVMLWTTNCDTIPASFTSRADLLLAPIQMIGSR